MIVLMGVVLAGVSFATDHVGRTAFGRPLGEDFAEFYNAGSALNQRGGARLLYNQADADRRYRRLFPNADPSATLPYLYPPVVALAFRPFARVPYRTAFALWLVLSGAIYALGLYFLWHALGRLGRQDRWLAVLACVAFEPFVFETWLGGQLSVIGFAGFAGAIWADRRDRPYLAGVFLGACFYKPTLLLFAVPLLILSRRWRSLAGAAAMAAGLIGTSVLAVGGGAVGAYWRVLLNQVRTTSGHGAVAVRRWKFVDLNSALRLMVGDHIVVTVIVAVCFIGALALLAGDRQRADTTPAVNQVRWAAVLTATVVINVYVGIYDTVLVGLAVVLLVDAVELPRQTLSLAIGGVFLVPWATQLLARATRFQPYTVALMALFLLEVRFWRTMHGESASAEAVLWPQLKAPLKG